MYTEYSKVLNYFKSQAMQLPNTDLRDILYEYARIKLRPDDVSAAHYLISKYHWYTDLLQQARANTNVS